MRYAYAYNELARLINSSPPTLVAAYEELERVRMQTIEAKHETCKALLLEYFEAYDADQREAFGHDSEGTQLHLRLLELQQSRYSSCGQFLYLPAL